MAGFKMSVNSTLPVGTKAEVFYGIGNDFVTGEVVGYGQKFTEGIPQFLYLVQLDEPLEQEVWTVYRYSLSPSR